MIVINFNAVAYCYIVRRLAQPLGILGKFRICPAPPFATVPPDFNQGLCLWLPHSDIAQRFADSDLQFLYVVLALDTRNGEC